MCPGTVEVFSPATDDEWRHAATLIAELKQWDLKQSEALGFDGEEVLRLFYPGDIDDLRRESLPPDGCLLLAMDGSVPVGCAAYRRLTADTCELYDVYVRSTSRGRRVGLRLLERLMRNSGAAGYRRMCLETATFMHDAHELYSSLGFEVRSPYRSIPATFVDATIWMERELERFT